MEIWKDIKYYEGYYKVSNLGNVKSISREVTREIGPYITKERNLRKGNSKPGYYNVSLCVNSMPKSFLVHRLVAHAFLENPLNKKEVNHKNGIKTDNRVENLEWVTPKENCKHAKDILNVDVYKTGSKNKRSEPTLQISLDGFLICVHESRNEAARNCNIPVGHISEVVLGKRAKAGGYLWQ